MWVGVGAGVGVGVGVDFSKPESESESESLKSGRLRSPADHHTANGPPDKNTRKAVAAPVLPVSDCSIWSDG